MNDCVCLPKADLFPHTGVENPLKTNEKPGQDGIEIAHFGPPLHSPGYD
jgi:hypothetical protein